MLESKSAPKRVTASASSNLVRMLGIMIKRIQWTVGFNQGALGYMEVDHGSGNIGMSKQLFKCYNVQSLFQQMGGIRMPE